MWKIFSSTNYAVEKHARPSLPDHVAKVNITTDTTWPSHTPNMVWGEGCFTFGVFFL